MNKSPRLIAFELLHRILNDNSYSNLVLESYLNDIEETSDRAFITALVYGVVERLITLDYFIDKYVSSKPKPKVLTILRLGAYQLLFMDKIPVSAAINESVKLSKEIKQEYYAGFINAVLHKIDNDRSIPDDLSVKYSVPKPLINMWLKQYGEDVTLQILEAVNERPPVFAVPNTLFVDEDELSYELLSENVECEALVDIVRIDGQFNVNKLKCFKNGLFHIEDMSAFECAKALEARENDIVLDTCSAPGSKAFTIAERMNNTGKVICCDIYDSRVELISEGAQRLGLTNIEAIINDASVFNGNIPVADRIICDVPCSGFGIIRRKPEIRYKELDSVKSLPQTQLKILSVSSKYLKTGGRLVYATCTLNKKENEKVVSAFLSDNTDFKLEYEKTIFPSREGGDGFYYAVLTKYEN